MAGGIPTRGGVPSLLQLKLKFLNAASLCSEQSKGSLDFMVAFRLLRGEF